jgi:pimeloyl-ACP methyl ester carboxylesterase
LLGVSQGGPVSVAYAARHPERVSKLILVGAYVRGRLVRADTDEARRAAAVQTEIIRLGWGSDDPSFRMVFPPSFMPDAPELWSDFAQLLRRTTSAESAVRIITAFHHIDVSEAARQLQMPTMIFHGRDDLRVPFDQAREYAALIEGSQLVPLDTRNHLMLPGEPAWHRFLGDLRRFLDDADPS